MSALLVPLDGSQVAEAALPMAMTIAQQLDTALHLVQVRGMTPPATQTDGDAARAYMDDVAARARRHTGDVAAVLIPDEPAQLLQPTPSPGTIARVLTEYGARQGVQLIVMTTHGRGGLSRRWFGSVAEAMLCESRVPVLLVRSDAGTGEDEPAPAHAAASVGTPTIARVLIATADDDDAFTIVSAAQRVTRAFDPHYVLLRVVRASGEEVRDDLADSARQLRSEKVELVTPTDEQPARAILDYASGHHIDLIVMGTHARRGLDRLLLGSVANKVVRGADCSVLVVPPRD